MKPGKRTSLTLLLLGIWAAAIAQAPPGEEPAAQAEAGEKEVPCVPTTDTPQAITGESGPLDSQQEDAGQALEPCKEEGPKTASGEEPHSAEAPGEIVAGPEVIAEEDSGAEASVEEVFQPGDEISKDYPVPLPSDI